MFIVTPAEIDDARLVSSNITETVTAFDSDAAYVANDLTLFGKKIYKAAVGMGVSSIEEFDPAKEYITGDKVTVKTANKVFGAISGAIRNDFTDWNSTAVFFKGQYSAITTLGKIYIAKGGEDPTQHPEWDSGTTYASGDTAKVTPVYDLKNGNTLNQIRVYRSRKSDNLNKPPASNLTGSTPSWELVGICNVNSPPDTSVLYEEHDPATLYPIGGVCKVTSAKAAFVALKENINTPPASNLIGSAPAWKRLEGFEVNQQEDNLLWAEFDVLNIGIDPVADVLLDEPTAWKEIGFYNIGLRPDENIYVAPTSDTDAVGAWFEVGYSNKWRMFDSSVSSVSSRDEHIEVEIDWTWCDTIALFNIAALSVDLELKSGDDVLYSESISTFIDDYTSWDQVFFTEPKLIGTIYKRIGPSFGAILKVRINMPSGAAKCGHCVVGTSRDIGLTRIGLELGIEDFSQVTTDEWGDRTFSKGNYSSPAEVHVRMTNKERPFTRNYLEERRSTPLIFNLSNDNDPPSDLVLFGWYKGLTITVDNNTYSLAALSIGGLT